jgi:sugar phosphate isomerase/epimerase
MTDQGYDICKEIRQLGKERICQIHIKENGALIGQGKVDLLPVRDAIADIGYHGWLILEGATVRGKSLVECYQHNQKYLRTLFPAGG